MAISYANKVAAGSNGGATASSGGGSGAASSTQAAPPASQGDARSPQATKRVSPTSKLPAGRPSGGGSAKDVVTANERLLFGAQVLIGYKVEVQVKSGSVYEGIFHTMHITDSDVNVVIKYAKLTRDVSAKPGSAAGNLAEKPVETLLVHSADVVQVVAKDVRFTPEDLGGTGDIGFETDASISRHHGSGATWGRELQAWVPDGDEDELGMGLEFDGSSNAGWDQFAANKEKFGVETTFDEHIYTTKIDRSKVSISDAEAARLAREIESNNFSTTNVHILEERGVRMDDSGDADEEEKYSAVVRPGQGGGGGPGGFGGRGGHYQGRGQYDPRGSQGNWRSQGPPAPPAPRAWGNAGSGVAAVAGRHAMPPPPPPSRSPGTSAAAGAPVSSSSQPIPMPGGGAGANAGGAGGGSGSDGPLSTSHGSSSALEMDPMRREANKVRSQLMAETGALAAKKDRSSPYGTPKSLTSPLVQDAASLRALHLMPGKTQVDPEVQKDFQIWKQQQHAHGDKGKPTTIDDLKKFSSSLASSAARPADAPKDGAQPPPPPPSKPADAKPKSTFSFNPNAKPFTLSATAKEFVPPGAAAKPAAPRPSPPPAAAEPSADGASSAPLAPPPPMAAAPPPPAPSGGGPGGMHGGSAGGPVMGGRPVSASLGAGRERGGGGSGRGDMGGEHGGGPLGGGAGPMGGGRSRHQGEGHEHGGSMMGGYEGGGPHHMEHGGVGGGKGGTPHHHPHGGPMDASPHGGAAMPMGGPPPQPGMPGHGVPPGSMPMYAMQMGPTYMAAPAGMPPGQTMMYRPGMQPVGPNGMAIMPVAMGAPPYAYAMPMPGGAGPSGRPPFGYPVGVSMGAMPMVGSQPVGPMSPMDGHGGPPRMGSDRGGGPSGKGPRGGRHGDRKDGNGGMHGGGDGRHGHHPHHPAPHGGAGASGPGAGPVPVPPTGAAEQPEQPPPPPPAAAEAPAE